jgi:hypothetical protein
MVRQFHDRAMGLMLPLQGVEPGLYAGKRFTCATPFYTPVEVTLVKAWAKVTGKNIA